MLTSVRKHLKIFYAYLLAGFWEFGNVFERVDLSIHVMHFKRMRRGCPQRPMAMPVRGRMSGCRIWASS